MELAAPLAIDVARRATAGVSIDDIGLLVFVTSTGFIARVSTSRSCGPWIFGHHQPDGGQLHGLRGGHERHPLGIGLRAGTS